MYYLYLKNRLLIMNVALVIALVTIISSNGGWLKSFCEGGAIVIAILNVAEGISRYNKEKEQMTKESV